MSFCCEPFDDFKTGIGVKFAENPEDGIKFVYEVPEESSCSGLLLKGDVVEMVRKPHPNRRNVSALLPP